MDKKRSSSTIIFLIIAACAVMAFIDAVLSPNYFIKSVIKIILFFVVPVLVIKKGRITSLSAMLKIEPKKLVFSLILGAGVFLFILAAYFLLGPYFDFSNVTDALGDTYGVKKNNFILVALYISFINSFLEEFFFRGIGFLTLKKLASRRMAYLFSATVFSLYHIAIMSDWFQLFLFLLLIISLFLSGLLFNWLDEKYNSIYNSWLVHMCANFSINTVGFILFEIL